MYVNSGIKHAVDWFRGEPKYTSIPKKGMTMTFGPLIENPISTIQCHHCANIGDINVPDTSPYLQGSLNILSGTVGTVGSSAYIIGTDGVGAALGGSTALTLSIGQISVGVSQIGDELRGGNNKALQASGSLPGYMARSMNSPYSDYIDTGANLMSTQLGTSGGVMGALKGNFQGLRSGDAVLRNGYEAYDTGKAVYDLGSTGYKDLSTRVNNLKQTTGND